MEAVTEDQRIKSYTSRKAALRDQVAAAGEEALMVFAADKVSKVRELRIPGAPEPRNRGLVDYQRCWRSCKSASRTLAVAQLQAELHLYRSTGHQSAHALRWRTARS